MAAAGEVADAALVLALAADPRGARSLPAHDARWVVLEQRGETLAQRLAAVFDDLFRAGAGAVVAVNSDSPAIPAAYLRLARRTARAGTGSCWARRPTAATTPSASTAGRGRRTRPRCDGCSKLAPMGTSSLLSWTLAEARRAGFGRSSCRSGSTSTKPPTCRPWNASLADGGPARRGERRAGPARGLPAPHEPLRQRLPALLQPGQPLGARRALHGRVASGDRRLRGPGGEQLRLSGRRSAAARRPLRAARARDRPPRSQGAVVLQQPDHARAGRRAGGRGPWPSAAAGEHRRPRGDPRRAARAGQPRRRAGLDRQPAGGRTRAGGQHRAAGAGPARAAGAGS